MKISESDFKLIKNSFFDIAFTYSFLENYQARCIARLNQHRLALYNQRIVPIVEDIGIYDKNVECKNLVQILKYLQSNKQYESSKLSVYRTHLGNALNEVYGLSRTITEDLSFLKYCINTKDIENLDTNQTKILSKFLDNCHSISDIPYMSPTFINRDVLKNKYQYDSKNSIDINNNVLFAKLEFDFINKASLVDFLQFFITLKNKQRHSHFKFLYIDIENQFNIEHDADISINNAYLYSMLYKKLAHHREEQGYSVPEINLHDTVKVAKAILKYIYLEIDYGYDIYDDEDNSIYKYSVSEFAFFVDTYYQDNHKDLPYDYLISLFIKDKVRSSLKIRAIAYSIGLIMIAILSLILSNDISITNGHGLHYFFLSALYLLIYITVSILWKMYKYSAFRNRNNNKNMY